MGYDTLFIFNNTLRYDTIRYDTIRHDTTRQNTTRHDRIADDTINIIPHYTGIVLYDKRTILSYPARKKTKDQTKNRDI